MTSWFTQNNISSLSNAGHNRAFGQISERLNVQVSDIKNVINLGINSSSQHPDVNHATVKTESGQIGYALVPRISRGAMLDVEQLIDGAEPAIFVVNFEIPNVSFSNDDKK